MKKSFVLAFFLLSLRATASHIVGGEFELTHSAGFKYRLSLILFFDNIHGNPGARDQNALVTIFRRSDNARIMAVNLPLISVSSVDFTQPACSSGETSTDRLLYADTVLLLPDIFNHPGGYYVSWERCCRNYEITNIYSEDPSSPTYTGKYAGQTFYLEFPAVVKDGKPFRNSSPRVFPPLADYACLNRDYYADFQAIDPDGDSLAYSIITPLSTLTQDAIAPQGQGRPGPYPNIQWRNPFDIDNVMNGNPDISISRTGRLLVRPTTVGLYVFAIKCEEFRNGGKIGEVRRDYQLLVVDCPPEAGPIIQAKTSTGTYSTSDLTVHFSSAVDDYERCIQVKVTDDYWTYAPSEVVNLKILPFDITTNTTPAFLTGSSKEVLDANKEFAEFQICFDRCTPSQNNAYTIQLVAWDDACGIPMTDTLKVTISIDVLPGCAYQEIDFPPISDKSGADNSIPLNAQATSGLNVTYESTNPSVASVASSTLTLHNPGWASIKATQPGDQNFRAATTIERGFCVNPEPPVLTFEDTGTSTDIVSDKATNIWYVNGNMVSGQLGQRLSVSDVTASYTAKGIVDGCIGDESASFVIPVTPVTGIDNDVINAIELFPNPVYRMLTVVLPEHAADAEIQIFSAEGKVHFEASLSEKSQNINLESLHNGMYFVRIVIGHQVKMKKIMKY